MQTFYRVISPVLHGKYLQDEIIASQELGTENEVAKYLSRGALREASILEKEALEARNNVFVLPSTTVQNFVQWLWAITDRKKITPIVDEEPEGYYSISPPGLNYEYLDSKSEGNVSGTRRVLTPLVFYMLPLPDGRLKVQMRRGLEMHADFRTVYTLSPYEYFRPLDEPDEDIPVLSDYLLKELYKRWPDSDDGNVSETPSQEELGNTSNEVDEKSSFQSTVSSNVALSPIDSAAASKGHIKKAPQAGARRLKANDWLIKTIEEDPSKTLPELEEEYIRRRNDENKPLAQGADPNDTMYSALHYELKRKRKL